MATVVQQQTLPRVHVQRLDGFFSSRQTAAGQENNLAFEVNLYACVCFLSMFFLTCYSLVLSMCVTSHRLSARFPTSC